MKRRRSKRREQINKREDLKMKYGVVVFLIVVKACYCCVVIDVERDKNGLERSGNTVKLDVFDFDEYDFGVMSVIIVVGDPVRMYIVGV